MIRTGQGEAILLTPSLTGPPLTRQDFRSPCDVELAGEDCTSLRDHQAMFLFDYDSLSGFLTNKIQEYKIQPKRLIFPVIVKVSRKNFEGKSSRSIGGPPFYLFCN